MAVSRRKQLHPKSLKDDVLPDELKFDEESNEIVTRIDLKQDHRFGPFPAIIVQDSIMKIEDRIECFQLLDVKHNWLSRCAILDNFSSNFNFIFQDNQIFAVVTKSIPIGTRLCSNKIILPKLNMNNDIKIKEEYIESENKIQFPNPEETEKHFARFFACETCGIRFSNQNTLDAHRQHYCTKQETTKSHSTDSLVTVKVKSTKRKSTDMTDASSPSTKRLSLLSTDTYCSECDILFSKADNLLQHKLYYCPTNSSACKLKNKTISFDRPIQIGPFIYVPIPIISAQVDTPNHDNKPLDLSKPKTANDEHETWTISSNSPLDLSIEKEKTTVQQQIHQCDYCSIRFSSLKTLHAHQDSYCAEYRKQKKNETKSTIVDNNRSPSLSPSTISKMLPSPSNDPLNTPHRSTLYTCHLCKYRGNTIRGMRIHFKLHLSNNELCSDEDFIRKSINNHSLTVPTSNQLLLKCQICSAMFDYEDTLLNHIKCVHTNETLLECLECQSRFCSKWNLLRHMKLTHTNIKYDEEEQDNQQIKLDQNDKSTNPMNLIRHIKNSSNKIKRKFICPYCHIKFGCIDTLKQHMTTYCSSRPLTDNLLNSIKKKEKTDSYCSSCQISFQRKTSYDAHRMYYCRGVSKARVKIQA